MSHAPESAGTPPIKKPVTIALVSLQVDGDEQLVTQHTHAGTLYERAGYSYLLYDDAGTSTTLRMEPHEIRIYRRGEIESWQFFQLGELTGGMLVLAGSEMILRVRTSHFALVLGPQEGRLELHYELLTGENSDPDTDLTALSLGKFQLTLVWEAGAVS